MAQWTMKEQSELLRLAPEMTINELMAHFGRSKNSVYQRLVVLGASSKPIYQPWTVKDLKILESMYQDFSYEDVAKELGRPSASVRAYINRKYKHDVKCRRTTWKPSEEHIERIRQLRAEGYSIPHIVKKMRVSITHIKKAVSGHSIPRRTRV